MSEDDLPRNLSDLLRRTGQAPDGLLDLTDDSHTEDTRQAAERLTDLGLLRIVTARRYALTDEGHALLTRSGGRKVRHTGSSLKDTADAQSAGWWHRLFTGARR